MGDIAAFGAGGLLRRERCPLEIVIRGMPGRLRGLLLGGLAGRVPGRVPGQPRGGSGSLLGGRRRTARAICTAGFVATGFLVAGCTPDYNWRDTRAPGGEYWVQLPAKPATLTRRIHLEAAEVDMTMQGAKVRESAFTIGLVPLPPTSAEGGPAPERILTAMREQMLRNIGASPAVPLQTAAAAVVDGEGRKTGTMQLQAISASGAGRHASMRLQGRFGVWRGQALQIVAVGPDLDPEQAEHFLDSLKLVER